MFPDVINGNLMTLMKQLSPFHAYDRMTEMFNRLLIEPLVNGSPGKIRSSAFKNRINIGPTLSTAGVWNFFKMIVFGRINLPNLGMCAILGFC